MADCWSCSSYYCGYGMSGISCTISGANPPLAVPSYISQGVDSSNRTTSGCSTISSYPSCIANTKASSLWRDNCTPPSSTPWQLISTGPYTLDVGATGGDIRPPSGSYFTMSKGHALAMRFNPTSRFLPYIMLHNVANLSSGTKTVVEIRENSISNLPIGSPGDNNILGRASITLPMAEIPHDCGGNWLVDIYNYNRAVPINCILKGTEFIPDVPYWIIFYSEDFACSDAYIGGIYERVKFATSNTGINDTAIWSQTPGTCASWSITSSINSISFATYKTTSGTPAINVLDYGFAELIPAPAYVNSNCFGARSVMEDKNVAIGIKYEVPRHYNLIRLSIAYKKPDNRTKAFTIEMSDITLGLHEIFVDTGEKYSPGVFTDVAVTATVLIV